MFAVVVACSLAVPDPRPARWAAELASPRFAVRAAAADALEKAGAVAVPALVAAAKAADPEAATRAAALLARVNRRQDAERLLTPTVVRLPAGPQTVSSVLDALAVQSGYHIDLADPAAGTTRMTPPAGPLSVWAAVRAVCDAAGLEVTAVAPRGRPKPPDTSAERKLAQLQAELEVAVEDSLTYRVRQLNQARQDTALHTDPQEVARLEAQVRRQEDELQGLLRHCFDKAVRREVAKLTAGDPDPDRSGRIVLKPAAGPPPAVAVVGGVRVEGRAAPPRLAAGVAVGQVAVLLRVRPEPRRTLERVDGVWVRRATADGRELPRGPDAGADGPLVLVPISPGHIRLPADGKASLEDRRLAGPVGVVGPAEAVVRVVAPPRADKLAELFGLVRAVVRDDPGELLSCAVPGVATADGLRLAADPPVRDETDRMAVDVTVSYDPAAVRPGGGAGVRFEPDLSANVFARGGFIGWNGKQAASVTARAGPTADGLTVLDAGGRVLEAVVLRAARADGTAGRVADRLHLRVTTKEGQGPPARLTFGGARAVPVDLPFALADVPVAAGTATGEVRHD